MPKLLLKVNNVTRVWVDRQSISTIINDKVQVFKKVFLKRTLTTKVGERLFSF